MLVCVQEPVQESSEIFPNGLLRSKIIFRPENKFTHFFRGTKFCSVRNKGLFRAERLRIFPFRGTKFFSVVFQKNLVVGSRRTGVFSADQNFFPNGIFLFLVFSARNKILFRRKKYFSVQKIQADFFSARKKEKKANWNIFRGLQRSPNKIRAWLTLKK